MVEEPKPKIVRHANGNGGPCSMLGPVVRETTATYAYSRRNGPDGYISKRLAHIEPCPTCPDHPGSRFPHLAARL
jgi:hypothetical protein